MTDFYASRMGVRFYEHTMPELVRQLKRLNENLERRAEAAAQPKENEPHGDDDREEREEGDREDPEEEA